MDACPMRWPGRATAWDVAVGEVTGDVAGRGPNTSGGVTAMVLFRGSRGWKLAAVEAFGALTDAGGLAAPAATQAQATPIRHVAVIFLENQSFDSLLGYWCDRHPGRCP